MTKKSDFDDLLSIETISKIETRQRNEDNYKKKQFYWKSEFKAMTQLFTILVALHEALLSKFEKFLRTRAP